VDVGAIDILGDYGIKVVNRTNRELVVVNDIEAFLEWRVSNSALKFSCFLGSAHVKI